MDARRSQFDLDYTADLIGAGRCVCPLLLCGRMVKGLGRGTYGLGLEGPGLGLGLEILALTTSLLFQHKAIGLGNVQGRQKTHNTVN